MKKEEIIVGTKVWYYPTLGDSKREEAVITSGPYEMCGTVCCNIDTRSSVVCIDNLKKKIIKMEKKFKKGDIVCVYYFHGGRKEIHETEVISSGTKYITTKYDHHNKFDAESLYSDYGGYNLFKGTKEECEKYLSKLEDAKTKCREISHYFDSFIDDFDLVNKVYDLVFNQK